jgi:hypothetical protein
MVGAVMGHQSEASSAAYWHPNEDMAAEVRAKIITELSQILLKDNGIDKRTMKNSGTDKAAQECPCCHAKLYISKGKIIATESKKGCG